jgi:hypothetical protein
LPSSVTVAYSSSAPIVKQNLANFFAGFRQIFLLEASAAAKEQRDAVVVDVQLEAEAALLAVAEGACQGLEQHGHALQSVVAASSKRSADKMTR